MWPQEIKRVVFAAVRVPEMSGGSTYVETMSEALAAEGVDVRHVSLLPGTRPERFPTTVVYRRERLHAGPVLRGGGSPLRRLWAVPLVVFKRIDRRRSLRRYRRAIESLGSDSVVIFTHVKTKAVLRESGYRRRPGGPVLIGQHHSTFASLDHETWLREAIPAEYDDLDVFTALTDRDAEDFQRLLAVPCFGIGNPLPAGIQPGDDRPPVAVAFARFSAEKQLDVMIRAFAQATSTPALDHWRLHIYGDGDLRDELQGCIDALDAGERVRLMGRTNDVAGVLRHASLNLLTSLYEGFPMTILEAAAAAVPTVVFDCSPGVRLLAVPGGGYLVPAQDEAAFVGVLRGAMQDPAGRAARGAQALAMSQRYSGPAIVDQLGTIISRSAEVRAAGTPAGAPDGAAQA